ncbi:exosortase/archaeosortase family protein [Anatilimnocola sp. NA78]|uniref:exosortase/archaeosortase family protein n=1 Tax=Anatilimnocola sp. NA78 TaxID=3415683 RepID=UPI003CE51BB1
MSHAVGPDKTSRTARRRKNTPPKVVQAAEIAPAQDRQDVVARCAIGVVVLAVGVWAYWPTLLEMRNAWERESDYSHGYLVAPLAAFFLWWRRDSFPGVGRSSWLLGSALIAAGIGLRMVAGAFYFESIDGWSILPWIAGAVAILFGSAALRWAAPSIAFLFFMVPLPFRMESMLSLPLQGIATKLSCWILQLLGQPAIAEGHTILIGEYTMEIAEACSGLRLFVSIFALAFAYLMLVRKAWWERVLLVLSVPAIAIAANAIRIVVTSLMYQYVSGEAAKKFSHDFAGWAMIPLAAAMFWLVLWYLGKVLREQEQLTVSALVRRVEI